MAEAYSPRYGRHSDYYLTAEEVDTELSAILKAFKEIPMHYRNGREAKNGDKIVKLSGAKIESFGVLHSATPGND